MLRVIISISLLDRCLVEPLSWRRCRLYHHKPCLNAAAATHFKANSNEEALGSMVLD